MYNWTKSIKQNIHTRTVREIETQLRKIIGRKSHVDMVNEQTDYDMVWVAMKMVCVCVCCTFNAFIYVQE